MRIFAKLFLTHAAIGFVSVVGFSVIFYFLLQKALIERTIDQLSSINILKRTQIEVYFSARKDHLAVIANDLLNKYTRSSNEAVSEHSKGCDDEILTLKQRYDFESLVITDKQLNTLTVCGDASLVAFVAGTRRDRTSLNSFRVSDVTVLQEDSATTLFYSIPFSNGYVFARDKFEKVQTILSEVAGMGSTGESYVVGKDSMMRSVSRFNPDRHPVLVNTISTSRGLNSESGGDIIADYRGIKVLSFYRPLSLPDISWVIISEIDYDEAMRPVIVWRNLIILITLGLVLLVLILTLLVSRAIAKPILYIRSIIATLSKGVIPSDPVAIYHTREVGQIATSTQELIDGLKRTTEFANETGSGNFDASFTTLSDQDTLGLALILMRDKLKTLNETQIRLVREKAAALLEGQENEQKRIVQELHDGVGQMLTAIRLQVGQLSPQEQLKKEIIALIDDTTAEVKRISYNLMPNSLVDFGLEPAIRGLCDKVMKYSSIPIEFKYVKEVNQSISFEVSISMFRIVQEGFNNILKHADASAIELYFVENQNELYFVMKDNGKGFDETAPVQKSGFGLRSMRERVKLLNGKFELHTAPGQGTVIEASIPIPANP